MKSLLQKNSCFRPLLGITYLIIDINFNDMVSGDSFRPLLGITYLICEDNELKLKTISVSVPY